MKFMLQAHVFLKRCLPTEPETYSMLGMDMSLRCIADFPEPVKGTTPAEVPRDPVPAVETTNPKPSTSSSIRLAGNKYPLGLARQVFFRF